MPSGPKSLSSLKKLAGRHPSSTELFKTITSVVNEPSDRSSALTIGALLEGALKLAIIPKVIIPKKEGEADLFGHQAPLRAFSSKIAMGFALGIYGPNTRADLDAIREVRNAFAHSMAPLKFSAPQVSNVCARITLPERATELSGLPVDWVNAQSRYVLSASWFAMFFDNLGAASSWAEPRDDEDPETEALFDGLIRAIAE